MASSLLSSVRFGSFLVYSPRGTSEISKRSQRFTHAVKTGRPEALPLALMLHLHTNHARALKEEPRDEGVGHDLQVRPLHGRVQVRDRRGTAHAAALRELIEAHAVLLRAVEVSIS